MNNLTLYLRHKRLDKNKTISDMAKAIGTTCSTYSVKERGLFQFNLDEINKICKTLEISDQEIIDNFFCQRFD